VIIGETAAAIQVSEMLLDEGVFVTGFGYPWFPREPREVRCQLSAAHTREDLDQALAAFRARGSEARIDLAIGVIRTHLAFCRKDAFRKARSVPRCPELDRSARQASRESTP
jgi:hypothetical protein